MNIELQQFYQQKHHELFGQPQLNEVRPKLDAFIAQIAPKRPWHHGKLSDFSSGKVLVALPTVKWRLALLVTLEHLLALEIQVQALREANLDHTLWGGSDEGEALWQQRMNWFVAARELLRRQLPLEPDEITLLLLWLCFDDNLFGDIWLPMTQVIKWLANHFRSQPHTINRQQRELLVHIRLKLGALKTRKAYRLLYEMVDDLLDGRPRVQLQGGEAWSDQAIKDIEAMEQSQYENWCRFIQHCKAATGSKPTMKWQKQTCSMIESIDYEKLKSRVLPWFELVEQPRNDTIKDWAHLVADPNLLIIDEHMDTLRGLVWSLSLKSDPVVAQALVELALSCFIKVAGVGERAVKLGTGCIYALGQMSGEVAKSPLLQLQQQVTFRSALKAIDKALVACETQS